MFVCLFVLFCFASVFVFVFLLGFFFFFFFGLVGGHPLPPFHITLRVGGFFSRNQSVRSVLELEMRVLDLENGQRETQAESTIN